MGKRVEMNVIFNELAREELNDAIEYYELELSGLGDRFENDIKRGIKRIFEYPQAWSVEKGEIRKYLLHKFPYKILYSIEPDYIYTVAIAHQHQRPNYWVNRFLQET